MNYSLYKLDITFKLFLLFFILSLTTGVLYGLIYLYDTTSISSKGAVERLRGSENDPEDEFEIREQYPKSGSELLMTVHNHIIGFSFIFVLMGGIFYFNTIVTGWWKKFFLIEPFISVVISFSSLFAIRFIDRNFVYLTILSSSLIYISFFAMAGISVFELIIKKKSDGRRMK